MAERVADNLIRHDPGMPRFSKTEETLVTAGGLVDARHGGMITQAPDWQL
jgi:hypothetical protein